MPNIDTTNNNNDDGGAASEAAPAAADASYSMMFSPAASSLASTPGAFHGTNAASTQQQQQGGGGGELEIHWDPSMVKSELLQASAILSHRGLKLASKWAAEQMAGIPVGRPASLREQDEEEEDDDEGGAFDGGATNNDAAPDKHDRAPPRQRRQEPHPRIQPVLQEELLNMTEQDWYAKSLVELGEYLHAAAVLSQDDNDNGANDTSANKNGTNTAATSMADITQMGPPLPHLSSYGMYLRAYALYMAGERRKEEEYAGLERY